VLPVNWWNGEMGSTPGIATIIKEEERYSFFFIPTIFLDKPDYYYKIQLLINIKLVSRKLRPD
jgi:hypothetical protein